MPPRKKPTPETESVTPAKSSRKKAAPKATSTEKKTTRSRTTKPKAEPVLPGEVPTKSKGKREQDLVIVESPAKAKTINKYLGSNFKVLASYGHVRDLPPKGKMKGEEIVGVNIASGWKPRYVIVDRQEKGGKGRRSAQDILDELKREAEKSNRVYLATDPDREGEAIAWHIEQALELDDATTFRITFNEITRSAVQAALSHPEKINELRKDAQEARRMLDRVVGYPLSNLLGKKVTRGLSAGRVQSVAVRLIVEREREIEAFKSEEFWKITALLAPEGTVTYKADPKKAKTYAKKRGEHLKKEEEIHDGDGEQAEIPAEEKKKIPAGSFLAQLVKWNGNDFKAGNEKEADAVYNVLNTAAYTIRNIEQKDTQERPQPPFTTSTLQQQASIRLRFTTRHTMSVAQELYQGVQLGSEGSVALITYMRTDSTRISDDAMKMVRTHIESEYGKRYLPEKPNLYKSGKSAQEAHEAIRPTDLSYTPESVKNSLTTDQLKLYTLIYNRFVASQMTPAVFAVTNVEVEAGPGIFKAQGKIEKFDGYRKVMTPGKEQEDTTLPPLSVKQKLDKLELTAAQAFTQPPPRYNEASLVKTLEKEGIGRPSTYATIISTIQARGYVKQEHRRFYATEIGKTVNDLLVKHFEKVVDTKFTSHIEEELDEIENGKITLQEVLNEFWKPFSDALAKAEVEMPKQKGVEIGENCPKCGKPLIEQYSSKTGGKFIGCSGWKDKENPCSYKRTLDGKEIEGPKLTEHICPACGKQMIQKEGRFGAFLTCSGAPECKTTMNFGEDGKPVVSAKATEHLCEKCGKPMVLRQARGKHFLGCSGYPKCRNAMDADEKGNPIKPADTGISCEKCNSPMIIKRGPRGPFLSCSAYPKCKNAKPINAELKEKLKDLIPAPAPKKETPKIEVTEKCPNCDSSMVIRRGFGGKSFLGCSTYPNCKGTRQITPEMLEQMQAKAASS